MKKKQQSKQSPAWRDELSKDLDVLRQKYPQFETVLMSYIDLTDKGGYQRMLSFIRIGDSVAIENLCAWGYGYSSLVGYEEKMKSKEHGANFAASQS